MVLASCVLVRRSRFTAFIGSLSRIYGFLLCRHEGIIPAIESSHALAHAIRIARRGLTGSVLVSLSGRGDKDLDYIVEHYGYGPEFLQKMEERRRKD